MATARQAKRRRARERLKSLFGRAEPIEGARVISRDGHVELQLPKATPAQRVSPEDLKLFPPGMIGVPTVDWMWTDFVSAYLRLKAPVGSYKSFERGGSTIAEKRNHITEQFLAERSLQWILHLDSDMTPPADTVQRLLGTGCDVVTAVCLKKRPPYSTCTGHYDPETGKVRELLEFGGTNPVREVEWAGTACLLVRRHVVEAITPSWFEALPAGGGSDMDFSEKIRAAGFKLHCLSNLHVGHIAATSVDLAHRIAWNQTELGRALLEEAHQKEAVGEKMMNWARV